DSAGAEAPEAGAVAPDVPEPGDGMGVVVAPPAGAVAGVTAGESEPCLDARLTPMAAPRLPATRASTATPPTSAIVRRPATGRVPRPSPGGGEGSGGCAPGGDPQTPWPDGLSMAAPAAVGGGPPPVPRAAAGGAGG